AHPASLPHALPICLGQFVVLPHRTPPSGRSLHHIQGYAVPHHHWQTAHWHWKPQYNRPFSSPPYLPVVDHLSLGFAHQSLEDRSHHPAWLFRPDRESAHHYLVRLALNRVA